MEVVVKHFNELTIQELFEIYKLRVSVFVVEQACHYQEIDDADPVSYHVYFKEDGKIVAYLRVLPKGVTYDDVAIGRVIAVKRRQGYGTRLLEEGIKVAKEKFNATKITLGAQVYAKALYEKVGFKPVSDIYLEDDIPHIDMTLEL